ncbi:RNA pseudouridine synthase [Shewanella colwelliana]|uniref:RNA pseudouridine synthase n=1 Tax=Shewanella colwelliana TaxID=23 RepID=A0A1E5IXX4_SHECO|nr:RluA family pseudouridine synthase [Shewanella colwelliana]OEG75400.1 RNA pseudouridine synthase [Shewanella colwelliana]GIU35982.1 putative RNA pseudouridine synthase [Shewanella colwelliana]
MTSSKFECHLTIATDDDAVALLAAHSQLSKQVIKQAMTKGAVWLTRGKYTQRLRRAKKRLKVGDELHLYYNQAVLAQTVDDALLLLDKGDYSIWYKPYAMLCQGSKWSDHTTINRFVETHLSPQRPAFIIHRLDRAATGLVLIGHSKSATAALAALFEQRQLDKQYRVIVEGEFPSRTQHIDSDVDGKVACSHATLIEYDKKQDRSLVQVKIDTGRKHQIRIHMASLGHPVVGDRQHGHADEHAPNLQLTACFLTFICPISGETVNQELPDALKPHL